jgi:hypothetical protein
MKPSGDGSGRQAPSSTRSPVPCWKCSCGHGSRTIIPTRGLGWRAHMPEGDMSDGWPSGGGIRINQGADLTHLAPPRHARHPWCRSSSSMSMDMAAHVRSWSHATRSARHLRLVMASHVHSDAGWAWPSLETLARALACTRRPVRRWVAWLDTRCAHEGRCGHGRGPVHVSRVHPAPADQGSAAPCVLSLHQPARQRPVWRDAHGCCHGERLPDRRPRCARER